jgi:protein TonB
VLNVVEDDVEVEEIQINTEDDKDVEVVIAPPVEAPEEEEEEEEIFMIVESMPEFPGGQQAMMRYIAENIKYPVIAQENGIQGRVICQFVVEKDGKVSDIQVVRSSGEASLDKEAQRVIGSMPKWKPGKQRGKPVRVKYTLPVNFRLQ